MKKSIIMISAIAAILAAACQTQEFDAAPNADKTIESPGIFISVNVSLPEVTKTSYTDEGNVIKSTWCLGDSISVVAFNANSQTATVRSIDTFALRDGADTSVGHFEGWFTGGDAERIVVYYPNLNPTEIDEITDMPSGCA